jgi:hypothetical protein
MDEEEDVMELANVSQFLDKMPGKGCYEDEHQIFLQGLMCILSFKENMQLMEVALTKCQLEVSKSKADNLGVWHLSLVQANLF